MSNPTTTIETQIERIKIDPALQSRTRLDEATIARYVAVLRAAMQDGIRWPFPALVTMSDRLVDGHHRLEAARQAGWTLPIPCVVHSGSREDAVRLAVAANAGHGLPRTREDVRRAVLMAVEAFPDESTRGIAKMVGCSHQHVANLRNDTSEVSNVDSCPAPSEAHEQLRTRIVEWLETHEAEPFTDENGEFIPHQPTERERLIAGLLDRLNTGQALVTREQASGDFTAVVRMGDESGPIGERGFQVRQLAGGELVWTNDPVWSSGRVAWSLGTGHPLSPYRPAEPNDFEPVEDGAFYVELPSRLGLVAA